MSKEMKVGLVLVLILVGVFGAVVYRRLWPSQQEYVELSANAKPPGDDQSQAKSSGVASPESTDARDADRSPAEDSTISQQQPADDEIFFQSADASQSDQQQRTVDAPTREVRQASPWDLSESGDESQSTHPLENATSLATSQSAARSHLNANGNATVSENPFFDTDEGQRAIVQADSSDNRESTDGGDTPTSTSETSNQSDPFLMDLSPPSTADASAQETRQTTVRTSPQGVQDVSAPAGVHRDTSQLDHSAQGNRASSADPFADNNFFQDADPNKTRPQESQLTAAKPSIQLNPSDSHPVQDSPRSLPGVRDASSGAQLSATEFDRQPWGAKANRTPLEQDADERSTGFRKLDTQQQRASSQTSVRRPTLQLDSPRSTPPIANARNHDRPGSTRTAAPWNDTFQQQASQQHPLASSNDVDNAFAPAANSLDPSLVAGAGVSDYVVQANDSYWTISKKQYGTGRYCRGLALYNQRQVADPRELRPGMRIKTPTKEELESAYPHLFPRHEPTLAIGSTHETAGTDPNQSVVQQDDNFWKISQRQYGSGRYFRALARHNRQRIPNPQLMRPGLVVLTPAREVLESLYPDLLEQTAQSENIAEPPQGSGGFFRDAHGEPMFRVGSTDTLTSVAQSHLGRSSRWTQIYEMNRDRLKNPDRLKIGTVLRLPTDASRVKLVQRPAGFR